MRRHLPIVLLCTLALPVAPALADNPLPFKGRFDFTLTHFEFTSPTTAFARGSLAGNETHLGKFTGEVAYDIDLVTGQFAGTLTKRAANGDLLDQVLTGQFTPTGSVGTFVITGGTGRFRDATGDGSFVGTWTDEAMSVAHFVFDGRLILDHGR